MNVIAAESNLTTTWDRHAQRLLVGCAISASIGVFIASVVLITGFFTESIAPFLNTFATLAIGFSLLVFVAGVIICCQPLGRLGSLLTGTAVFVTAISSAAIYSVDPIWIAIPIALFLGLLIVLLRRDNNVDSAESSETRHESLRHGLQVSDLQTDATDAGFDEKGDEVPRILECSEITQQVTRSSDDRLDSLAGYFRVHFEPKQKLQAVHIPFCPAFEGRPAVETMQFDGPETTFKITTIEAFGVRIELRLKTALQQSQAVVFELLATVDKAGVAQTGIETGN